MGREALTDVSRVMRLAKGWPGAPLGICRGPTGRIEEPLAKGELEKSIDERLLYEVGEVIEPLLEVIDAREPTCLFKEVSRGAACMRSFAKRSASAALPLVAAGGED